MKTKLPKSQEILAILAQLKMGDSVAIPVWGTKDNAVRSVVSSQAKSLGIQVTSSLSPNRKFLTVSRPVVVEGVKGKVLSVTPVKEGGAWRLDRTCMDEPALALKAVGGDVADYICPVNWNGIKLDPAITVIQKRLEKAKASVKFYEDLLSEAKGA
jgi:hypothetical protein